MPAHRFRVASFALLALLVPLVFSHSPLVAESLPSAVRIASPEEPGEPLLVTGVVVDAAGGPVAGAWIYAYHTDARGYYSGTSTAAVDPRLTGRLETDEAGRYEIRTIKPTAYPDNAIPPAHIHLEISAENLAEQHHLIQFADDPRLGEDDLERSRRAGRFGRICELRPAEDEGREVLHCVRDIRLR